MWAHFNVGRDEEASLLWHEATAHEVAHGDDPRVFRWNQPAHV